MPTIIWSTESVDTSAVLLAQALDGAMCKGDILETTEIAEDIKDNDTNIIFYGAVPMPIWLQNYWNENRMFNLPEKAKLVINRSKTMENLSDLGIPALKYIKIKENTTYTKIREILGTPSFDLLAKGTFSVYKTVENANAFNQAKATGNVAYACKHLDRKGNYRVFVGLDSIVKGGIIGFSFSEKRTLSFRELLLYGRSEEAKSNITDLFEKGLLADEMGQGKEAWSEEKHMPVAQSDPALVEKISPFISKLQNYYKFDFCAVDFVKDNTNTFFITNITCSPSLQADTILSLVADYFGNVLLGGREVTADSFIKLASTLTDEEAKKAFSLLREANLIGLTNV